jgi:hypothetical protein
MDELVRYSREQRGNSPEMNEFISTLLKETWESGCQTRSKTRKYEQLKIRAMQNYYKPLTNVKIITDRLNHLYLKYLEPNTVMRMRVLSRNIRQQLSSYPYVKIHDRKMAFTISYIDSHRLPVTKNLIDEVQEYFAYKNWSESSESEVEM